MAITRERSRKPSIPSAAEYLDTLIPIKAGEREINGLKLINRDRIIIGDQPRRSFPPEEQHELMSNIRELKERKEGVEGTGLLAPLLVVPQDDKYLLVAGERRYRATTPTATWVGVEELPCIVIEADGNSVRWMQLIENLQRQSLPPLEEAEGIHNLMRRQKLSYRDVAKLLGKDKGYIENRLRLLKAGEDVQNMVSLRKDTLSHAYEIDRVQDPKLRRQLIKTVLNEGASVSEVRRRIEAHEAIHNPRPERPEGNGHTAESSNGGTNGGAWSNSGDNSWRGTTTDDTTQTAARPDRNDPIEGALRPATSLIADAVRQLESRSLTAHYRNAVLREVELLEKQIAQLKKVVR
ncbi:MAG: ParB/RepB/Spo0J family partition protein [Abitibacteriaceae bacterium]|nr:ParB/RepB/Spo0J family partition protein [Abditibacteriaceae bacterium]MBV9867947.1 ParB/RepB/Spo0J family partition protein [Abditibacteriaceae bacterium]